MVTMLDCIKRVPSLLLAHIERGHALFDDVFSKYDPNAIDEICLIGSGTSHNSALTARYFMESVSGVRVTPVLPNEFLYSFSVRNPKALYVFISQTGTSSVTQEAVEYVNKEGYMSVCISEKADTPIARAAGAFIDMGCGREEYPMRTIGYSMTVFTLMLLGLELGFRRGTVDNDSYAEHIQQATAAAVHIPFVIHDAENWVDRCKRRIMKSAFIAFTGADSLYGVAVEAAVKVWEAPQFPSAGYELDEGMHGPNYGYNHNHALILLNNGGRDEQKLLKLARYMKNEHKNGYIIGRNALDDKDLSLDAKGGVFACLEFAAAIQVFMYRLSVDGGRDFFAPNEHTVMESYFNSHNEPIK